MHDFNPTPIGGFAGLAAATTVDEVVIWYVAGARVAAIIYPYRMHHFGFVYGFRSEQAFCHRLALGQFCSCRTSKELREYHSNIAPVEGCTGDSGSTGSQTIDDRTICRGRGC